jgi:hypothetical protein
MIKKSPAYKKRIIDLDGPEGNAFFLLGSASKFMRELGYPESHAKEIMDEMKSADYVKLVKVFDREFGGFVTLETSNEELLRL